MPEDPELIEFYGTECVHCNQMKPLVAKLEKELKLEIIKLEVWHNSKNAEIWKQLDNGKCGGVPFFYNKRTNKWICGAVSYSELKKWAIGK